MEKTTEHFDDLDKPVQVDVTVGISGDWRAEPMKVITGITQGIKSMETTLAESVRLARKQGATWEEIGKALGVSRQSAWERFSVD
ncbi:helix-turn-helix domain-containing protein [Tenggerimyces flavus]|uniref:Uncharacterized protein n=1 Tax=Tenggerimyces flavus TaxID=1708749 RepID=A0ABV7Y8F1_9ACTN|nr:hypothetical protein [Tenggerimyces flavus]MBM7785551.1 hypothetical protein [Tenggerimyces flavus]